MSLDEAIGGTSSRKRAERLEVTLSRQAAQAVKPIRSQVQGWQARTAHLRAMAAHRRAAGQPIDAIVAEAAAINQEIDRNLQLLDECAADLPETVRRHSRFQDVVRALSTAAASARAVGTQ